MPKTTKPSQKIRIDEHGIEIAPTWYRKSRNIPWERVLAIAPERSFVKVWYTSDTGVVRRTILGDRKLYQTRALNYWKQKLIADLITNQELTGSYVYCSSARDRYILIVLLMAGIGFFGYWLFIGITTSWNWLHYGWPEFRQLTKWVAYYAIVPPCIPCMTLIIFLGLLISDMIRLTQWRSWNLTKHGLLRQHNYGQWETIPISSEAQICPNAVIVGGEELPLWRPPIGGLTNNAVILALMGILAKQHNIVPVQGKRDFPLGIAVRFLLFWPLAILSIWYAPLLVWDVPKGLDLNIGVNFLIVIGSCIAFSVVFLIAYFIEAPQYHQKFSDFLTEIEVMQEKLGW